MSKVFTHKAIVWFKNDETNNATYISSGRRFSLKEDDRYIAIAELHAELNDKIPLEKECLVNLRILADDDLQVNRTYTIMDPIKPIGTLTIVS